MTITIHPTADIHPTASVGAGVQIWNYSQVRAGAHIGEGCILARDVYIDSYVSIGRNCKIQNGVSVYHGVTLEDGVFCGPYCVFTNDKNPRAINPDSSRKTAADWNVSLTRVLFGASIGAHATIVCGVTVGRWSMVGAGSVVTKDVPDHALVVGNPATVVGCVCFCGKRVETLPCCKICGFAHV